MQLTAQQLLSLMITKILEMYYIMALVRATWPNNIAPKFASLLEDEHSSLEHFISSKNVTFEPGSYPLCTVGTLGCLEEYHQDAKLH